MYPDIHTLQKFYPFLYIVKLLSGETVHEINAYLFFCETVPLQVFNS
jgi:hypothetical protein